MKWQPIETAPKDGLPMLGWMRGWRPFCMHYCEEGAGWSEDQPGWYDPFAQLWVQPTHWMHLPEPPK